MCDLNCVDNAVKHKPTNPDVLPSMDILDTHRV